MLAANMIGGPLVAAAAGRAPRNRRAWPGGRSLRALPAPARAVLAFAHGAEGSSAFGAAARVLPREKIGAHALAAAFDGKSVPRCAHTLALCDAVLGMGIGPWPAERAAVPTRGPAGKKGPLRRGVGGKAGTGEAYGAPTQGLHCRGRRVHAGVVRVHCGGQRARVGDV